MILSKCTLPIFFVVSSFVFLCIEQALVFLDLCFQLIPLMPKLLHLNLVLIF